jgi:hypothetical protein
MHNQYILLSNLIYNHFFKEFKNAKTTPAKAILSWG